ncbi:MAG: hypothetical protein U0234_06620 [Sandaracinus sp.]
MDLEPERRAAAATVIVGMLFAQGTHLLAAAASAIGLMTATSADGAMSATVVGAVASWVLSAGVIGITVRRAREPRSRPSTPSAVAAVATALVGALGGSALSTFTASMLPRQIERWQGDQGSVGEAISRLAIVGAGVATLGFLVQLFVSIFALAWLLGRESPRDPG